MFGLHSSFVVQRGQLVLVLGAGIGVAQADRQVGRVAAAEPVGRYAPGQRPDEADLDLLLGAGRGHPETEYRRRREHGQPSGPLSCHGEFPPLHLPRTAGVTRMFSPFSA
jgi:hypothetical protein